MYFSLIYIFLVFQFRLIVSSNQSSKFNKCLFSNQWIIVFDNCDYNINQNNRDYDFCQNQAALIHVHINSNNCSNVGPHFVSILAVWLPFTVNIYGWHGRLCACRLFVLFSDTLTYMQLCVEVFCPARSQDRTGLTSYSLTHLNKCSLLRVESKPLFPELSCTIFAVAEHYHLCFTSVYSPERCTRSGQWWGNWSWVYVE